MLLLRTCVSCVIVCRFSYWFMFFFFLGYAAVFWP